MDTYSKRRSQWELVFDTQKQLVVFKRSGNGFLYIASGIVIIASLVSALAGVFITSGPGPYSYTNQYGDAVKIFGSGIYKADSYFRAPIFQGTDLGILLFAIPYLIVALARDIIKSTIASRFMLLSALGVMLYYAASIAFGVQYNSLHLLYIVLFSSSLFAFLKGLMNVGEEEIEGCYTGKTDIKGITIFLMVTCLALSAAWLPAIIQTIVEGRPRKMIENYTTEITNLLDLGIIVPACIICFYMVKRRRPFGFVLLDLLLTLCIFIGLTLPLQTIFQVNAGISPGIAELVTKVGSFVVLSVFAFYFKWKLMAAFNR